MSRNQLLLLVVCLLFSSSGCTGRYGQGGAGWLAGSPTVAPPPTYSLTIPSVARNQPYYNPSQTNAGAATTPMVANAAPGQLNGWIPKSDNLQTATIAPNSGAPGQTQLGPTAFAGGAPTSVIQTASNSALPGSGTSFTDSPNYRTTSIDETQDQTRLPATDATSVRAPAMGNPTGQPVQFAQFPPPQGAAFPGSQPVYAGTPVVAGPPAYAGAPVYAAQPTTATQPYPGAPTMNSNGMVQAQSTATYDAANGAQMGWRDREISSGSSSYNR